jgi:hypothetical protein
MVSCDRNNFGCSGGWLTKGNLFAQTIGMIPNSCVNYTSGTTGLKGKCPTLCDDKTPFP